MASGMWEMRNAIWAAPGYIDDEDKKRFRWLTEGHEQQRTVLMEALGYGHALRGSAIQCGKIDDPDTNYMRRCGIPLCPRCFMTERRKQIRQATRKRFVGVPNEQLAFATILLPMATMLSDVSDIIDTEKTRIRNMVSLKRRKDSRWDNFEILGWWELDRMTYSDFEGMGRKSSIALEQLGIPLVWFDDATIWRPHLHAIVRLDQLSVSEVADAFRNNGYGAAYQVDIRPFKANRRVGLNIKSVIQYALKFRVEDDFKAADSDWDVGEYDLVNRKWWPAEDIKAYAEWLCEKNAGFQSLRFSLGMKGKRASAAGITTSANLSGTKSNASPMQATDEQDFDGIELLEKAFDDRFDLSDAVEVDDCFLDEHSAHGIFVEGKGGIDGGSSVNAIRYKNPYTDTNWIGFPTQAQGGGVVSLAERLRSIGFLGRANLSSETPL